MEKFMDAINRSKKLDTFMAGVVHSKGQQSWEECRNYLYQKQIEVVREHYTNFWLSLFIPSFYVYADKTVPSSVPAEFFQVSSKLIELGFVARTSTSTESQVAVEACVNRLAEALLSFGVSSDLTKRLCEVYLPWPGFDGHDSELNNVPVEAMYLASNLIKGFDLFSGPLKKIHACRILAMLGYNLNHPSNYLIIWTKDGAYSSDTIVDRSNDATHLIRLAEMNGIQIFNLNNPDHKALLLESAKSLSDTVYKELIPQAVVEQPESSSQARDEYSDQFAQSAMFAESRSIAMLAESVFPTK